jgi:outer membrane lipoprotein carrier protein
MAIRRVQKNGEGIVSVLMRLNSGSKANTACMTGWFIAGVVMALGVSSVCLLSNSALAMDTDVKRILKGVEDRYNHTPSLQVAFTQSFTLKGRKTIEKGELYLRKPGKMRWQYTSPPGKLFVSDGKYVYYLDPDHNRAEKTKFKETEDMRAPLAFLLGKLQFENDFREFRTMPNGLSTFITAIPKSDKLPYTEVSFLIDPDFTIRWLDVKGQDSSQMEYAFSQEKRNTPAPDKLFMFTPPPGVEYVDSTKQ